jgi:hypothetical protein
LLDAYAIGLLRLRSDAKLGANALAALENVRDLFDPSLASVAPLKVGRFTPGMHIPVIPADELAKRRPDYALILAWNFADEIMRQQESYLRAGGKFIVPIPSPRIAG